MTNTGNHSNILVHIFEFVQTKYIIYKTFHLFYHFFRRRLITYSQIDLQLKEDVSTKVQWKDPTLEES